MLVRAGLLDRKDLEGTLKRQSSSHLQLGELLVETGCIDEEQLLPFLSHKQGVASVRLREGLVDPNIVTLIPRHKAEATAAVALFRVRERLFVAMADPESLQQIDEIERLTGFVVQPLLALRSAIEKLIPRIYEDDFSVDGVTAGIDQDAVEYHPDAVHVDLRSIESQVDGSPIISLVNYIIVHAVREGASDIHIEPGMSNSAVRLRIDGQLREVLKPRRDFHAALVSRVKVMAKMDIAEHRLPQDGRMHVVVEGNAIDLRASTLPTVLGEKVVLRVLDRKQVTFNLDALGVPDRQLCPIKTMLGRPWGLVLVTGPTGSGKTTTLYSAMELIKSIHRNIVTVEDPVEYQLELINQVHANTGGQMSFAKALRAILRQDPDVIMIGEIRDAETAEIAIQAALTGHLVLSTLHTNDSAGAIARLTDMGVAPYKVASAFAGVIAQRLVRTVCPHCRTHHYPPAELLETLRYVGDRRRQFVRGEGCNECFDTGYRGRTGIYELLVGNPEFRDMISGGATTEAIRKWSKQNGAKTLLEEGIELAESGRTSLDEVMRVAYFD
ncbi:UNVERIFIED_CONTAM: hypothetical protein GTU68_025404 [Idotea baltica]|nr:hypothetical protein [Idotea baltica]